MPILEDIPEDDIVAREEAQATIDKYEKDKEQWWFKLGIYYGTLLQLILYVPDDYSVDHYFDDLIDTTTRLISTNGVNAMLSTF